MKKQFILGTDWWTDCDDAVALRIISHYIHADKIELLGIIINGCMEHSVASVDGFLTIDGIQNIPLGLDTTATDFGGNPPYQKRLAAHASAYTSNEQAEDAVRLYRKLLANATQPVEMIEIGYLQAFAALLQSGADDISDKTGIELIQEKVNKVWVMAGKWSEEGGKENNFCRNARSRKAGAYFCQYCPVPVTFLGYEVGDTVITGGQLPKDDPLYQALCDHTSVNGRSSWDPMLTLMAIIGDENEAGYDVVKGHARVDAETGANYFSIDENGPHQYVIKKYEDAYYAQSINNIIEKR